MLSAKVNHQSQPSHPSQMPLAEANQQLNEHFIIGLTFINLIKIHNRFNIHQQLKQIFIIGLTFITQQ